MECYGEKMLPNKLPNLIYQVTPPQIIKNLKLIVHSKGQRWRIGGCIDGEKGQYKIHLFPTVIMKHSLKCGVISFAYWLQFLKTTLHEIGHAVTDNNFSQELYDNNLQYQNYVESLANNWRDEMLKKIASRSPRLGQPEGWIGGLPGIYILRHCKHENNIYYNEPLNNYRAYMCGGQYSLSDLVSEICSFYRVYGEHNKRKIMRMIKKESLHMGITRHYIDKANRKHLFFNYGEAMVIKKNVISKDLHALQRAFEECHVEKDHEELDYIDGLPF
jgi:hypothetical protein